MAHIKGIKFLFLILVFIVVRRSCLAQDSIYISHLINHIAQLQSKDNGEFLKGLFPSYISNREKFSSKRPDNNIFYNGLIAYILKDLSTKTNENNQRIIDSIVQLSEPVFEKFKNQKGRGTYNFWRTDTAFRYPYMGLVNLLTKKTALPDDMDDTVLSLLALDADDSSAKAIHDTMQLYVNNDSNKVRTVIRDFVPYNAYSTWFGKKFPVVFDVSVLCNVLSFVQHYDLKWTKADSAGLNVILTAINGEYYINQPLYASPYYPETSLILYHIARLMNVKPIEQLEALKPKLVKTAQQQLEQTNNILEKIILSSTLLKWGQKTPDIVLPSLPELEKQIGQSDYSFFAGNVPSYFSDWWKKYATTNGWFIFYHYCPAFNDVLLLEYLLLKNKY